LKGEIMDKVKNGHYVQVHYEGTLQDGKMFDTSRNGQPLEVKVGEGQVIKGFEEALIGMAATEKKKVTLSPDQAYGERDESLERAFARSQVPPEMDLKAGDMVSLQTAQGQQVPVQVKSVDDQQVVVDLNHPLAGETLIFDLEVMGITDQPTQAGCACGCAGHESPSGASDGCGSCGSPGSCH
jgi:peptidylprolyl isomerase